MINVKVASLIFTPASIKKAFKDVLTDYCFRFNEKPIRDDITVHIMMVQGDKLENEHGVTTDITVDGKKKIFIQVRDFHFDEWEDNFYTLNSTYVIMAHEFTHACQMITNRKGIRIKINKDTTEMEKEYYFSPREIEARILQDVYANLYTNQIKRYGQKKDSV